MPYTALAGHLTSEALRQTDNSRYKMVALTFDDGPTRSVTLRVMRNLRRGCAEATFFIVGERIPYGPEYLAMQHDAGFITGSHNYVHDYPYQVKGKVIAYRDQLNEKLTAVTGRGVSIMRAPGGDEKVYINEDVHLPLIHWTLVSADAGGNVKNPESEARRLASKALDGRCDPVPRSAPGHGGLYANPASAAGPLAASCALRWRSCSPSMALSLPPTPCISA